MFSESAKRMVSGSEFHDLRRIIKQFNDKSHLAVTLLKERNYSMQ